MLSSPSALAETLFPKLVCYGRFGSTGLSLAAATTGGRVLLHSPHAIDTDPEAATFLRIRGTVQALAAGTHPSAEATSAAVLKRNGLPSRHSPRPCPQAASVRPTHATSSS